VNSRNECTEELVASLDEEIRIILEIRETLSQNPMGQQDANVRLETTALLKEKADAMQACIAKSEALLPACRLADGSLPDHIRLLLEKRRETIKAAIDILSVNVETLSKHRHELFGGIVSNNNEQRMLSAYQRSG